MPKIKLPTPRVFEWDDGNKDKNWIKHQVEIKECEEVFKNKPQYTFEDFTHSRAEKRYTILGFSNANRYLFITYTIRSNAVRVISARNMDKKERKLYEEKNQ